MMFLFFGWWFQICFIFIPILGEMILGFLAGGIFGGFWDETLGINRQSYSQMMVFGRMCSL